MPGRGVRLARATCGCPTPSATTTWSRASPGSRSSSPDGRPHVAPTLRPARCRRRTCTCTSPGRCGTRPCSSWPQRDGIRAARRAGRGLAAAAVGGRREGLVPLPAALRRGPVGAAHRGRRTPAGAARPPRTTSATAAGWLEIQVDPSGYAARFGGITAFTDLVLDAVARRRRERTGLGHRGRDRRQPHPAPARRPHAGPAGRRSTPAAASSASGCPTTSGAGAPRTSRRRSAIAERAGLLLVPHGGELRGPEHVRACLDAPARRPARPRRPRRPRTRRCSTGSSQAGVALEVCPVSNVALGVYSDLTSVPLPPAARGRRHGRARRRRPAAVRLPAGRPVRHDARRPRAHRRARSPSWPGCRSAASRAPDVRQKRLAEIDAWLDRVSRCDLAGSRTA